MTILLPQLREELLPRERTQWHWSKHVNFRPLWIMTVPQRLSFFAQLPNCNLATFGALNYDQSPGCSSARCTVPSLMRNWTAHSEGSKKAGFFVTEGEWQRKPRFNSQGLYAWLRNEWHLFILTYYASIKSVEKAWMWHVVPVSNHLLDTESEFAPWDPRKPTS